MCEKISKKYDAVFGFLEKSPVYYAVEKVDAVKKIGFIHNDYEKLEMDLQQHYEVYLERFRNLAYLEHELDLYNRSEQEKVQEGEDKLKNLQKKQIKQHIYLYLNFYL